MRALRFLLVLVIAFLILPFSVFADDEDVTAVEESKEVKVYLFRGDGCPHCQEAEEWFQSIEEEYGSYFEVIDYETWHDEENAKLMQDVAESRGDDAQGVPYIIIGNKSWFGFADDYKEEILAQIKSEFEVNVNDRYDAIKNLSNGSETKKEETSNSDALSLCIIVVIVGALGYGIYRARKAQ